MDVANPRIEVHGDHGSAMPSSGVDGSGGPVPIPLKVAFVQDLDGDGYNYFPDEALLSGDCPAAGLEGSWYAYINNPDIASDSQGDLGGLDSCSADCSAEPAVSIPDQVRAHPPSPGECGAYDDLHLCVEFSRTDASPKTPVESECAAGSGSFQLIPIRYRDKDRDGSYTMVLRAIQKSGSGVLTNGAWITWAKATQTHGQALRAIRVNRPYRIGPDDQLQTSTMVSVGVPAAGLAYTPGVLSGGAPFVMVEVPGATQMSFTADLQWVCRTVPTPEIVPAEPGYAFTLPQVGCPVNWTQKLVVRPEPIMAPRELVLSIYGSNTDQVAIPLTVSGQARTFDYPYGDLRLAGELLSWGATGATVRLDTVMLRGANVCTPGTYSFAPE